jgi:hypothetical protein
MFREPSLIRPAFAGIGLLLSAIVLASCGGSDGASKEDFITEADGICAEFRAIADERTPIFEAAIDRGDFAAAADEFDGITDETERVIAEIDQLEVPEGDEQTIDEWLELGREQVVVAGEVSDAIRARDAQAINAGVEEGEELSTQADEIADDYGMVDCGSAGDTA